MSCSQVQPLLDRFLDGELAPERIIEVEQHLMECERCTERLRVDEAIRVSTRRAVRKAADAQLRPAFEERLRQALAAERVREDEGKSTGPLAWRYVTPVAVAAGLALVFGAAGHEKDSPAVKRAADATSAAAASDPTAAVESLIEALVEEHATPTSPAVTEPQLLRRLEPEVGVPVHIPQLQQMYGARWEGGNVVTVRNERAASLRYRLDGHRVTIYVYDARRVPVHARLRPRVVRNVPVFVGNHRGYSIAAVENERGVGHAVATDLNDQESAELVVASFH